MAPDLTGWTPVEVRYEGDSAVVRWCFTEGLDFSDPFFDDTIRRAERDPFRLLFWRETDADDLRAFVRRSPGLELAGIVFHLSRSGSTLVAQLLSALPEVLVISEPPPVDQVLRAVADDTGQDGAGTLDQLRDLGSVLGQPRRPGQRHLVLKLDAWAVLQWRLLRDAFPDVPCVFVYRHPADVLASHLLGHRGFHMVPGTLSPALLGIDPVEHAAMAPEEYGAAVLARLCAAGLDAARSGHMHLVHYDTLPDAVPDVIAPLFGLEVPDGRRDELDAVARRDAKNPAIPFDPAATPARAPSPAIRAACESRVEPLYMALEAQRTASP